MKGIVVLAALALASLSAATPAQRVVALGPHALDMLPSLGIQPVGYGEAAQVAVTNYGFPIRQIRYLGSRLTSNPVNVGDRFKPNLEVIASLKPDLIVGENYVQEAYPALSRIAPTLLVRGTQTGDWQKSLPVLAKAVGREKQASRVIARSKAMLAGAKAALPSSLRGKTALVVWNAGGASGLDGRFFRSLGFRLDTLGAPQPTREGEGYRKVSSESLSATKADVIFVIASGKNTVQRAKKDWQANTLARRLNASKAGQVYFLDIQLFGRLRGTIAEELMLRELERQFKK